MKISQDQRDSLISWLRKNRGSFTKNIDCFRAAIAALGLPISPSSCNACTYFRLVDGKPAYWQRSRDASRKRAKMKAAPQVAVTNGDMDLEIALSGLKAQRAEHLAKITEIDAILDGMRQVITSSNR